MIDIDALTTLVALDDRQAPDFATVKVGTHVVWDGVVDDIDPATWPPGAELILDTETFIAMVVAHARQTRKVN